VAERPDGGSEEPASERVSPPARFDLRPGVPDLGTFPRSAWLAAARRASRWRPTTRSATATRAAFSSCASSSPSTSRAPAGWSQDRPGSSSAPASASSCGCSARCCRRGAWRDRRAVGALQALAPERVAYAGTAAKTLAPGLRLAWLVPPPALLDELVEAKRAIGSFPTVIDQLTLSEFLASGAYDRQVRRARIGYRRRRDRLLAHLAGLDIEVTGIAAGLHALAHLRGLDEREAVERAAERGLAIEGLGAYAAPGHAGPPALVIGYGRPPEHAYTAALARLEAALTPAARRTARLPGTRRRSAAAT
jgi:DNA-binding transcriptional MocR family regulator